MRWVSQAALGEDLSSALDRVLDEVRRDLEGERADLVLAFAVPGFDEATAAKLADAFPEALVIGANAAGVMGGNRELERRSCVAITAARLPNVRIHVQAFGRELGRELEARHLRASLAPAGEAVELVIGLLDPKLGNPAPLLASLDEAFPEAVVSGGLASGAIEGPCLLVDGKVSAAGGILVSLAGELEARAAVAQGCRPIGQTMLVTRVEGQLVYELGQRKAVDVMRNLHAEASAAERALIERALFLGVEMKDQREYAQGDFLIRDVLGIEPESGALAVGAELEPWKAVQFHLRDADAARSDLHRSLDRAAVGGFVPEGALLFSCVGRGEALYDEPGHDTRAIRERFGAVSVGGFFCSGEIGRVGEETFLHGYTSSIVLLAQAAAKMS